MKRYISMLVVAAAVVLSGCATQQPTASRAKVVIQVSEGDAKNWNLALNNAQNVQQAYGKENVDVEIVAYGPGIGMIKAMSSTEPRITGALTDGVRVIACENTMKKAKLTKADMIPGIAYVPGGVIEIMNRQKEGWAYIRP